MKYFISTIAIIALIISGYFVALKTNIVEAQLTVTTPESATTGVAGRQVLAWLGQLESLQMDTSIFTDPRYASLQDFTVDVGEQLKGRANPFLPASGVLRNEAVNVPVINLPNAQ